jgi:hypothetical protein
MPSIWEQLEYTRDFYDARLWRITLRFSSQSVYIIFLRKITEARNVQATKFHKMTLTDKPRDDSGKFTIVLTLPCDEDPEIIKDLADQVISETEQAINETGSAFEMLTKKVRDWSVEK